jgi:7,8-dihydro-6-hydroxymethylpterin dimethyltransferase
MRLTRPYTYLGTVRGMCRQCRALCPARVIEEDGAVYQERLCPTCGPARARLADRVEWYLQRTAFTVRCKPARIPGHPVQQGCPLDCGPCAFHANACRLPVFSVTNLCNLDCPICFTYNRPDRRYHMSREELRPLLDRLIERAGPFDLINVTGGEPTLHPDIVELLKECQRPEIGRVTMNSNGLRLARDEDFCRALADLGVYVVLSFDTLRHDLAEMIHGRDIVAEKLRALENLQRFGIGATLLNVMIRGVNEGEIGAILELARTHSVVRSVTVQTMTFTGHGGKNFGPRQHMPLDGAADAIEKATAGAMRASDFFPHSGAHPLCYSIAYYLRDGDRYRSFTEFFSVNELRQMLGLGYLLQPDATSQDAFKTAIDRLWADGDKANMLPALRRLLGRLYPPGQPLSSFQRQAIAQESILAVYLHSHMDEDTLDLGRLCVCSDQVPDPDGRLIPACAYNLFYRQRDPRFWLG